MLFIFLMATVINSSRVQLGRWRVVCKILESSFIIYIL